LSAASVIQFDVGSDLANGLASLLNTTPLQAGYILGGMLVVAFVMIALILGSKLEASGSVGVATLLLAAFGIIRARLFNWWPDWSVLLAGLFAAVAIVGPLSRSSGGA